MKKILLSLAITVAAFQVQSQVLLIDSFLYNPSILGTNAPWVQSSAVTTGATMVAGNGLIYPNYSNALSGAAEVFTNNGVGDLTYAPLSTPVTNGSIFAGFVINITTAPTGTSNPYCITLGDQSSFAYGIRLLVRKGSTPNVVNFGTRKAGGADVWASIDYPINAAHLIVLKYVFNAATAIDDECKLYINPTTLTAEPTTAQADASTGADFTGSIKHFIIRNNGGINTPSALIDEVHVGKTWDNVFKKPEAIPFAVANIGIQTLVISNSATQLFLNNSPANASTICIFSAEGKKMMTTNISNTISIETLPQGFYIVQVLNKNGNTITSHKFIK